MRGRERRGIVQPVADHQDTTAGRLELPQARDLVFGNRTMADLRDSQRRRHPVDLLRPVAGKHLRRQSEACKLSDGRASRRGALRLQMAKEPAACPSFESHMAASLCVIGDAGR